MTNPWRREHVSDGSTQSLGGQRVLIAEGKEGIRACGCRWVIGVRLDLHEPVFGARPCPAHAREAARAIQIVQGMPPSDREIGELYEELLEQQLDGGLA